MKTKKSYNQDYYDRKLARAEETLMLLAKYTLILLPVIVCVQLVLWLLG